jgi:hypothetical protein
MKFQAQALALQAAADFLGPGAIEIPIFEREIFDLVRRSSVAFGRFPQVKATGHPHRYFEQTAIATASATDPRNIVPAATSPTRVERGAMIKACVAQTNLSLFDVDVTRQQGIYVDLEAKDIEDIVSAIQVFRAQEVWGGTDTNLLTPTTQQWVGGLAQITQTSVIAPGASIIDGLKAMVALMSANQTYVVKPTAIYLNPILGDYVDREAKAANITLPEETVAAGVVVSKLRTQVGDLPMIADVWLPTSTGAAFGFSAPPAGYKNYYAAIIMEPEVEIPYVSGQDDNPNPRIFQLGLIGNLAGQYVGIKFDAIIFKGASYAHAIVCVQRP